tara:strand:+ start:1782 stop:2501 length:720 start_codon:yes stop_codon:yes gene_type:complete
MITSIDINKVLFIDIETVPIVYNFDSLSKDMKDIWKKKMVFLKNDEITYSDLYRKKAGLMAEFSKVICVSVGHVLSKQSRDSIRIKSFYGDDEYKILSEVISLLNKTIENKKYNICAHNGKEFDFPFLSKRIIINGLKLPKILDISGKKPWEINHLDTMELWRFGDYKNYISLKLLSKLFNIPNPKEDIEGSQVSKIYYEEKDLERIKKYCEKDTLTVAQIMLKFQGKPIIKDDHIELV